MTDMVERVARAISEAIMYQDSLAHYSYESRKEEMDAVARAAIEAMREPTETMISELHRVLDEMEVHPAARGNSEGFRAAVAAMIDAALTPPSHEVETPQSP